MWHARVCNFLSTGNRHLAITMHLLSIVQVHSRIICMECVHAKYNTSACSEMQYIQQTTSTSRLQVHLQAYTTCVHRHSCRYFKFSVHACAFSSSPRHSVNISVLDLPLSTCSALACLPQQIGSSSTSGRSVDEHSTISTQVAFSKCYSCMTATCI
jgi:hypothetical protein